MTPSPSTRAVVAASVAAFAPLAFVLGGCSTGAAVETGTSPTASSSTSPSTSPSTSGSDAGPPLLSDLPQGALPQGRYTVAANGASGLPRVVLDVPRGFETGGFFLSSQAGFLSYWGIAGLYKDPCTRQGGIVPVTGTATRVVDQLVARLGIRTSRPTPTQIDGHSGFYVELTSPDVDYTACHDGFTYWDSGDGDRYVQSAGVLDRLWVLDVEDTVVVLTTSSDPGTPKEAMDEARTVVETATFPRAGRGADALDDAPAGRGHGMGAPRDGSRLPFGP